MEAKTKRDQLKAIVLEQEQIRADVERLTARSGELDAELDRLLAGPIAPALSSGAGATAASAETPQPKARRRRGRATGFATGAKPRSKSPQKKARRVRSLRLAKPTRRAKNEPTLKEKILAALRDKPEGAEVGVVAQQAYGSDDRDARRRCVQNLYNMAKHRLVRHQGSVWQVIPATA